MLWFIHSINNQLFLLIDMDLLFSFHLSAPFPVPMACLFPTFSLGSYDPPLLLPWGYANWYTQFTGTFPFSKPQAGGLLGTSIVYLWRFMEKPANIRLWSRTQVSALPCMEDSGRRFGWSRMMSFPLWFPSVFQPWAWPGRRSKGEACMASGYIHASSERKRDTGTFCGISYGGERPR